MRILTFVFCCCLLSSCGKTGDLYLPSDGVGSNEDASQTKQLQEKT